MNRRELIAGAGALLLAGCGGKKRSSAPRHQFLPAHLHSETAGYYIVGSCTGHDGPEPTGDFGVNSYGKLGGILNSQACKGAPFSIQFSGGNPWTVWVSIGPLPVNYNTLSVPYDGNKSLFTEYRYPGGGGRFDQIPFTDRNLAGPVGLVVVRPVPAWGEISGPGGTVRRTFFSTGDPPLKELIFFRHGGTHNIELAWGRNLWPGTVAQLREEITWTKP